MKKSKLFIILIFALIGCMLMTFTACNDEEEPDGDLLGTPPVATDWAEAGLGNFFGAQVNGTLTANFVEEGEIYMAWQNSDKASFDDTVNWLQTQGYTQYSGTGAQVETENGMVTYCAEKALDGKTMLVELVYFTQDVTIAEQSFKTGDLYFTVTPSSSTVPSPDNGETATWPASRIQTAIGVAIPEYTGEASTFVFSDASYNQIKNVAVMAFGAPQGADATYTALLTQNGYNYVESDDNYVKQLANGDTVEIYVYYGQTVNPNTYQTGTALQINVLYNKNSGEYTSWDSVVGQLANYNDVNVPAFQGGTSFDILNATDQNEIKASMKAAQQSIINSYQLAEQYGQVTSELQAQYEEAQRLIVEVEKISMHYVTVYGTNDTALWDYNTALENVGFENGDKVVGDFQYTVEVGGVDDYGKAAITFTKIPQALLENTGGGSGTQQPTVYYTMPENLKIVYTYGMAGSISYTNTVIKIGDDYYKQEASSGIVTEELFFRKNGSAWDVYRKSYGESEWQKDSSQESERNYVESDIFDFIVDDADVTDYSDAVKGGQESIAGRTTDVYTQYSNTVYNKDTLTGLILKYSITSQGYAIEYVVTSFDTTVTAFTGIELPS